MINNARSNEQNLPRSGGRVAVQKALSFVGALGLAGFAALFVFMVCGMIDRGTFNPLKGAQQTIIRLQVDPDVELHKRTAEIDRCTAVIHTLLEQQAEVSRQARAQAGLANLGTLAGVLMNSFFAQGERDQIKRVWMEDAARQGLRQIVGNTVAAQRAARLEEYVTLLRSGGELVPGKC